MGGLRQSSAQLPVQRPELLETTSLGAAFAAGIAIGFWTADWVLHQSRGQHQAHTDFRPQVSEASTQAQYRKWQKAIQRSLDLADLADT